MSGNCERSVVLALFVAVALVGCRERGSGPHPESSAGATSAPIASVIDRPPAPRPGMLWVAGGALVVGTPPDVLPRVADEEMPGEQVILDGFFIDKFPHPNEEGAIPLTNVSRTEATTLCGDQRKRLCTELEWERACKGPDNQVYEYGERYRPEVCGMGARPALLPTGLRFGCASRAGVHDMHGGAWEWTASAWGRGTSDRALATLRGGNDVAGEIVGRCANARARPEGSADGTIGFRCCAGPANEATVVLEVRRGRKLEWREPVDKVLAERLEGLLPDEAKAEIVSVSKFSIERMWTWRPVGNEELVVAGGCAGLGRKPSCGLVVARIVRDEPRVLAWAQSGHWAPTLHMDVDPRDLWLFAGDDLGAYRRHIGYSWGRVSVGPPERKPARGPVRKKRK